MRIKNILIAAAIVCGLCACSKSSDYENSLIIRLGIQTDAYSRGAGSIDDITKLADAINNNKDYIGIYGLMTTTPGAASSVLAAEWTQTPFLYNLQVTGCTSGGALSWTGDYSYPITGESVKFCAYYPWKPTGVSGNTGFTVTENGKSPIVHFNIEGTDDVMVAAPVVGNSTTSPAPLEFSHLLTQLRFQLIDVSGYFTGYKIKKMAFKSVNTWTTLDVETGVLSNWRNPAELIFCEELSNAFYPCTITPSTSANPQVLNGTIMLEPGHPHFDMTISIEDTGGVVHNYDVRIVPTSAGDNTFAQERSYLITLRFENRTDIRLSATVKPWEFGGTGEGIIQ